jgi:hypothetical protein
MDATSMVQSHFIVRPDYGYVQTFNVQRVVHSANW